MPLLFPVLSSLLRCWTLPPLTTPIDSCCWNIALPRDITAQCRTVCLEPRPQLLLLLLAILSVANYVEKEDYNYCIYVITLSILFLFRIAQLIFICSKDKKKILILNPKIYIPRKSLFFVANLFFMIIYHL